MPINIFFIAKNHWEPYFKDNLRILKLRIDSCNTNTFSFYGVDFIDLTCFSTRFKDL
jgi:hypothetical protein